MFNIKQRTCFVALTFAELPDYDILIDYTCTLCIMPRSRSGPGKESHQNKVGRLRFAF